MGGNVVIVMRGESSNSSDYSDNSCDESGYDDK